MEKDNQDKRFRLIEVLTLSKPKWDCGKFVKEVNADSGLKGANVTVVDQGVEIESESGRYLAYVVPVDNPVPDGEAEEWARINYGTAPIRLHASTRRMCWCLWRQRMRM